MNIADLIATLQDFADEHGDDAPVDIVYQPGHPLAAPNLVASSARSGTRACLACSRARARVRHRSELRPRLDEIADGYLDAIIEKRRKTPCFSYGDIRRTVYTHWQLV